MAYVETLGFLWNTAGSYTKNMLPAMFLATIFFFAFLPLRRHRLARRGLHSGIRREGALFCFVLFCMGLGALTLTPPGFWGSLLAGYPSPLFRGFSPVMNLIPVVELVPALRGDPWNLFFLLGNMAMFAPLGFFPSLLWDKPSWRKAALIGFTSSFLIEFIQLFVARSTDVDDLILNTLGALCGYWLYLLINRLWPCAVSKFHCERRGDPIWTQNKKSNSLPES